MRTLRQRDRQYDKGASGKRRSFMLGLVLAAPVLFIACPKNEQPGVRGGMSSRPQPADSAAPIPGAVASNGESAIDPVPKQLDFGPRPPGSPPPAKNPPPPPKYLRNSPLLSTTGGF